jgi:hypothetical protein
MDTTIDREREFERVRAEWDQVVACAHSEVAQWKHDFARLTQEEAALRAQGRWVGGRDDLFGVVGIQRAEIRHTAMIGWLLDPCMRHGLGAEFLKLFLSSVSIQALDSEMLEARIACEVFSEGSRADIVVWLPSSTVVIEAKIDAGESPKQCKLMRERFAHSVGAEFVFLSVSGGAPETAGEYLDEFRLLSFRQVRHCLEAALQNRPGFQGPGRQVAEDYLRTSKTEFP